MARKVFLSSTFRDLAKHREAVIVAIESLDDYQCVRMENFGARDWEAADFCRAQVKKCDIFVGILGHLYGSCPKGDEKSYTVHEYEAAIANKKPRLMFFAPDDFPVPYNLIETEDKRQKQRSFREAVSRERIRDTFTLPKDLARRVIQAIHNWEQEQTAATNRPTTASSFEIRPLPPQPNFVHPYPLQAHFTGRQRERQLLTHWLSQPQQPLLALIAIGGMGKSALTWARLQRDVLGLPLLGSSHEPPEVSEACRVPEATRPEGVLWWSFYEREARFSAFLDEALLYAGSGKVDPAALPSTFDKVKRLHELLQQRRLLLVLDGFERELHAYASLSAAYQGEAIAADERGDFCSCTDPHAAVFLRHLAALPLPSRVLLTSRLFPRELEGLAGCWREELAAFDPEDAVTFFHSQGIKGTRAEIQEVCQPFGYHPLALRLFAGVILRDKRKPGDIQVASRYPVLAELKGKEQHHILQVAYEALDEETRDLLSRLAAFRNPISFDTLSVINPFKNAEQLDQALDELLARGLLLFDRECSRYDLHPIVRQYAYDRLADKAGLHTRLLDYFAAVPAPEKEKVQSVNDLAPVIELYHHTARVGRYDDACDLFYYRLNNNLYYRFGAHQTCIELLRALFPDGENHLPMLKKEDDQIWTLASLGDSYRLTGQPRRAVPLFTKQVTICEKQRNKMQLASALSNLAQLRFVLGEFAAANRNLRRSLVLSQEKIDEFCDYLADLRPDDYDAEVCKLLGYQHQKGAHHRDLGQLLICQGAFDKADEEIRVSISSYNKIGEGGYQHGHCQSLFLFALRALLMRDARVALEAARRGYEIATSLQNERVCIWAEWLLGTAFVALSAESTKEKNTLLGEAETHLTEALTRCRRINLVEIEPDILLAWACWHRARGKGQGAKESGQEAKQYAEDALSIADRCEYRLKQADIHNFLAQLALEVGDREAAKKHAATAHERAWCDGPPHCYKPALEKAERLLKELGVKQPRV